MCFLWAQEYIVVLWVAVSFSVSWNRLVHCANRCVWLRVRRSMYIRVCNAVYHPWWLILILTTYSRILQSGRCHIHGVHSERDRSFKLDNCRLKNFYRWTMMQLAFAASSCTCSAGAMYIWNVKDSRRFCCWISGKYSNNSNCSFNTAVYNSLWLQFNSDSSDYCCYYVTDIYFFVNYTWIHIYNCTTE